MVSELAPVSPSPAVPTIQKIGRAQKRKRGQQRAKAGVGVPAAEQQHDVPPVQHIDEIV